MKIQSSVRKDAVDSAGARPVSHTVPESPELPHEPVEPRRKEYPEWGDPPFTPHPAPVEPPAVPPEVMPPQG